jgi:hypothetical protein
MTDVLNVAQARNDILATQSADNYDEDFEVEEEEVASAIRYATLGNWRLHRKRGSCKAGFARTARTRRTLTSAISSRAANPIVKILTSKPQACLADAHSSTATNNIGRVTSISSICTAQLLPCVEAPHQHLVVMSPALRHGSAPRAL